jgi:hypothetical protein
MSNYIPPWRPAAHAVTHNLSSPMRLTDPSTIVKERVPTVQPTKNMRGGQTRVAPTNQDPRCDVKEAVRSGLQHYGAYGVAERVKTLPESSPVRKEAIRQIDEQNRKFADSLAPLTSKKK